jgi:hypothetical protein
MMATPEGAGRVKMKRWEAYEQMTTYFLDKFASEFGLDRVEGKQTIQGKVTGTTWEIDGKGIKQGDTGFVIVECRRYTTSKQNQEKVGGLAYRISDTGAEGGIIVSPLGLQDGARLVAAAANIIEVHLNENCNAHEFVLGFLNKMMLGVQDKLSVAEEVRLKIVS